MGSTIMSSNRTDVFPTRVDHPSTVIRLSRQPNFQAVVSNHEILAFIIYLDKNVVYYKKVQWNGRYQKHFTDTTSYIKPLSTFEVKEWRWTARKLGKDVGDNLRKNIDMRTCFKYSYNFFLVKSCFTTGQRHVQPGNVHLYQIGAVQMIMYFPSRCFRHRITKREKFFPVEEQHYYFHKKLRPNQAYVIPENTFYILYATNKSYFSVHILRADATLPFSCRNPLEEVSVRPVVDLLYRRPVPTPQIEEVVIGDEPPPEEVEAPPPLPEVGGNNDILITLESGKEVTESMMMPPPPPPPPPPSLPAAPAERAVQVVNPNVTRWYQDHFKFKEYGKRETVSNMDSMGYIFDLSTPELKNRASPVSSAPSPQIYSVPTPSPSLHSVPATSPYSMPVTSPHSVPATSPYSMPATSPHSIPATSPRPTATSPTATSPGVLHLIVPPATRPSVLHSVVATSSTATSPSLAVTSPAIANPVPPPSVVEPTPIFEPTPGPSYNPMYMQPPSYFATSTPTPSPDLTPSHFNPSHDVPGFFTPAQAMSIDDILNAEVNVKDYIFNDFNF